MAKSSRPGPRLVKGMPGGLAADPAQVKTAAEPDASIDFRQEVGKLTGYLAEGARIIDGRPLKSNAIKLHLAPSCPRSARRAH